MGASFSYVAIKSRANKKNKCEILDAFSLKEPDGRGRKSDVIGVVTAKDWYLLIADTSGTVHDSQVLEQLSKSCDIITGQANEFANYSATTGWSGGEIVWSVVHNYELDDTDLQVVGKPPNPFAAIKIKIEKEWTDTPANRRWDHYFEIPVALFDSLVGYRYDRISDTCDLETAVPLIRATKQGKKNDSSPKADSLARVRQFTHEVEKAVANAIEFAKEGKKDYEHTFKETTGDKPLIEGVVRLDTTEMRYTLRPNKVSIWFYDLIPGVEFPLSTGHHYTYKVRKGVWEPYNYSLAEIASERVTTLERMNRHYQHVAAGGIYTWAMSVTSINQPKED